MLSDFQAYGVSPKPLAERVGFEPTVPLWGTHALQACRFNQLSHLSVQFHLLG
jgi:hypothetical protein